MARPTVKTGDAITVIESGTDPDQKCCAVTQDFVVLPAMLSGSPGFTTTAGFSLRYENEGIGWLRGHLTPDAEEVIAARAAQVLRSSALSTRDEGGGKPTFNSSKALLGSIVGAAIGGMIGGTFDKKKGSTK